MFSTKFRVFLAMVVIGGVTVGVNSAFQKYNRAVHAEQYNALYRELDDRLVLMNFNKKGADLENLEKLMHVKNEILSTRTVTACVKPAAQDLKTAASLAVDSYVFAYANNSMHNSNILSALKKEDAEHYIELIKNKNAGYVFKDIAFGETKYPDSNAKELLFLLGAARVKELLFAYNKEIKACID